eukprot:TRINITY_DN10285_c0_g1_i1.p1 TRINITY_DN10285_c0_g1~~TRINITY_DN10285_c0_g1_i1.p1  ORF type:complete len:215 (-),score=24.96 TRINITY_DN10285_c0_g1_i1:95-739(-)
MMNAFVVGLPYDPRVYHSQWVRWPRQDGRSTPVPRSPDLVFADRLRFKMVCLNWTGSSCSLGVGWDLTHLFGDFHENDVAHGEVVAFEVKLWQYPRYTFEARRKKIHSKRDIACRTAIGGLGAVAAVGGAAAAVVAGATAAEIAAAAAGGAVFVGQEILNHRITRSKKRGISGGAGACLILEDKNGKLEFSEKSIEEVLTWGRLSEKTRARLKL